MLILLVKMVYQAFGTSGGQRRVERVRALVGLDVWFCSLFGGCCEDNQVWKGNF